MKYSIRTLLGLTLVVILGMVTWKSWQDARREQAHVAALHKEIADLEARAWSNRPALRQIVASTHDEFETLHAMRERAVDHFDLLLRKYSTIEPPPADVLALRSIPSLQTGRELEPIYYRLWVPEDRPVWLKFGVQKSLRSGSSSSELLDSAEWLTESPFDASGPYEVRLPPGDQMLGITTGTAREGSLPLLITLDGEVLLRSTFVLPEVAGTGGGRISAQSQIDFGPREPLPWLLTNHVDCGNSASGKPLSKEYIFSVWLSDQSSSFSQFPGV